MTIAATLGLTALLLLSRPGHMNLLLGQVTAQVVIGAYVALRWARTRPLLAGMGLALATLKPTYGVPLALLMLFGRGDLGAVVVGVALSGALCLVALVAARARGGWRRAVRGVARWQRDGVRRGAHEQRLVELRAHRRRGAGRARPGRRAGHAGWRSSSA